ncbi:type IV pili methyl-accepting chemotaxis transducer N-terminal domain-containing protein [Aquincola sp. S2]|uniref:Sensor protein n=1 Tax=Pseudaquabacterium terrae TaxID=2732868 RepID=A0ABX2EQP5_9BURK|nr:type IV pili methyl-accepting chemotaxis transducer N-terminal domain-containing protein [Aquabacterium terrae]NRF71027.1 type IV pili methyl-accepting chemotaxis transducer N-terminal domain-containing protein [Aquabacterium terrae]
MVPPRSLALRLVITGVAFLAAALASITVSLWVTWQLEGGAAAVNEAGRLRMMTYRMALEAREGRRELLPAHAAAFEATLGLLRDGDPSRPLFVPGSDETRDELARVREHWTSFFAEVSAPRSTIDPAVLVRSIDKLVGAIEHRLAYWTAALRTFQLAMVALAVVGAMLLLYTSHVLVLEPLRRVGAAIASLRQGDLKARVQAPSTSEFRDLAEGFNAMAGRLECQYAELEHAVRSKTADLQAQQQRLAALYEVSALIARAETLDEMARGFVGQVRLAARADAIALRWSDAGNQRYLLLAQQGLPPSFAAEEQCLQAGKCHCGQAAQPAGSRVIPIRSDDHTQGHCRKAGFSTLLTVPISLHHQILGEVDLFYRTSTLPSESDRSLIELLASHLAGGMEGLRAAAADKEAAVSTERSMIAQELHDSIAQSLAFLKIQVQLLRNALARGETDTVARTVGEIEAGVLESYGDVRELLIHFRTRADTEDIEPALRTTLRKFQLQTGTSADIDVIGHGVALPNDVQIQVLHIVQEALSNVRKHGHATAVKLRVVQAPAWTFEVIDNGAGFDTASSRDDNHVGLRIMAERAARIGARLSVKSGRGSGTTVALSLPSPQQPVHDVDQEADHVPADSPAGR